MKKVLWVLAALVVVMGALLGFAAYSANSLAARFKPDIERAASDALHASVSFGALSVSVFPSVQGQRARKRASWRSRGVRTRSLCGGWCCT